MALGSVQKIEEKLADRFNPRWERLMKTGGFIALTIGLTLVGLIIFSMLFAYK
jgi:hypothetical protein